MICTNYLNYYGKKQQIKITLFVFQDQCAHESLFSVTVLISKGKGKVAEVGRPIFPFFHKFLRIRREVYNEKQTLSLIID